MTVLDAYCNRGIGRILLTSLVDEARTHGVTTFVASVKASLLAPPVRFPTPLKVVVPPVLVSVPALAAVRLHAFVVFWPVRVVFAAVPVLLNAD